MSNAELDGLLLSPVSTIREAVASIDKNACGIVLIVDEEHKLLGTITDGDVRRAVLAGIDFDASVGEILRRKSDPSYVRPITAPVGASTDQLLKLMRTHVVRQIPLLDSSGRVSGLARLETLIASQEVGLRAVIMAGGLGVRLRPLTEQLPKPMLPVGGRPLMELIVERLRESGIRHVSVATHYRADKIINHFGDGGGFGVEIQYLSEDRPLGTAGALALMPTPQAPLLVVNGDILTQVDFRAMFAFHQEQKADMTVAVRQYSLQVPYGVIDCEGAHVCRLTEKPQLRFFVNAGIYLLEPTAHKYIRSDCHFDMTDLIQCLLDDRQCVVSFPIHEYWLDIGQLPDYVQAQEDVQNGRIAP